MPLSFNYNEWESVFFGFKTADIQGTDEGQFLPALLEELREEQFRFASWKFPFSDHISTAASEHVNGFQADIKCTFVKSVMLQSHDPGHLKAERYEGVLRDDLISLAIKSGEFSRFRYDAKFSANTFENLYKAWIAKSINAENGEEVFVLWNDNNIIAFVSLYTINAVRCGIDLIAVDKLHRRKGYGEILLHAALYRAAEKGYTELQVVTQERNIAACSFYRKHHFAMEKKEYVYHFWL